MATRGSTSPPALPLPVLLDYVHPLRKWPKIKSPFSSIFISHFVLALRLCNEKDGLGLHDDFFWYFLGNHACIGIILLIPLWRVKAWPFYLSSQLSNHNSPQIHPPENGMPAVSPLHTTGSPGKQMIFSVVALLLCDQMHFHLCRLVFLAYAWLTFSVILLA